MAKGSLGIIVKIQRPITSSDTMNKILVYAEGHKHMQEFQMSEADIDKLFGDEYTLKVYKYIHRVDFIHNQKLTILDVAIEEHQSW